MKSTPAPDSGLLPETVSTDGRHALISGATGGIGSETARVLTEAGWNVVALLRNEGQLGQLKPEWCAETRTADVRSIDALEKALAGLQPAVLVHAAGMLGPAGPVWQLAREAVKDIVDTNIIGTLNLIRIVVPRMVETGRGHLVLLGSTLGQYASGGTAAYGATKAAVHSIAQDLRCELVGSGIRVTEVVPGRVRTGMHSQLDASARSTSLAVYENFECLEASDVAEAILYAVSAPPRVDVTKLELLPRHQAPGGSYFHSNRG